MEAGAAPLGIIMLDADFHRPPGDVGNLATWPFPVLLRTVPGAGARHVVGGDDERFLDAFVDAGHSLAEEGAVGLITSCGFLAARQLDLAARMPLPLATSSLMQLPMVERTLARGKRAGVVTYDAEALSARHFREVGADPSTPVVGLPADGCLRGLIERKQAYERDAILEQVVSAVRQLLSRHRDIGAIVFECTNLPPFATAVSASFRKPVYDVVSLGRWFRSGLVPSAYL